METTKETTSATNPPLRHQINTRDTKAHLTVNTTSPYTTLSKKIGKFLNVN